MGSCAISNKRDPAVYMKNGVLDPDPKEMTYDIGHFKEDIKEVVKIFHKRCPPEDCYVLAPGRSLSIMVEYLNSLDEDYIQSFPLSSFAYNMRSKFTYDKEIHGRLDEGIHPKYLPSLSKKYLDKLFRHFDQYLDLKSIGDRKIYIIDFAHSGNSLFTINEYLRLYLKTRNLKNQTKLFGLATEPGAEIIKRNAVYYNQEIELLIYKSNIKEGDANWTANILLRHGQKPYNRYGKFNLLTDQDYETRKSQLDPIPYMKRLDMWGNKSLDSVTIKKKIQVVSPKSKYYTCKSILKQVIDLPSIKFTELLNK